MIIVMLFLHNTCKANDVGFLYKALIQTYTRLVFFSKLATIPGFFISRIVPHKLYYNKTYNFLQIIVTIIINNL